MKHKKANSQLIPAENPRFVWNIGDLHKVFTNLPAPAEGEVVLYDRQEQRPVLTLHSPFNHLITMELAEDPTLFPFTNLENWINNFSNRDLKSVDIPPTQRAFRK